MFTDAFAHLVSWLGNTVFPLLAPLLLAAAVLQMSRGHSYRHALQGAWLMLMLSGLIRVAEGLAGRGQWNNPDQFQLAIRHTADWVGNVLMPTYAAYQVALGALSLGALSGDRGDYVFGTSIRHFAAALGCLLVSSLTRLGEYFITKGTGGVS